MFYLSVYLLTFSNLLFIGSKTPWHSSATAPRQQDKNRSELRMQILQAVQTNELAFDNGDGTDKIVISYY